MFDFDVALDPRSVSGSQEAAAAAAQAARASQCLNQNLEMHPISINESDRIGSGLICSWWTGVKWSADGDAILDPPDASSNHVVSLLQVVGVYRQQTEVMVTMMSNVHAIISPNLSFSTAKLLLLRKLQRHWHVLVATLRAYKY